MPTAVHPVQDAFLRAVAEPPLSELWPQASCIFVGYSGGADSAALLSLTSAYCREHSIPCEAIHVHHGIRGPEADRDADACRSFCEKRGIVLHIRYADVPAYAETHHLGLEEAARQVRYGIFEEFLAAHPDSVCATAHSADDHLETVLFHLLRGSGIDGLCGIPPVRGRFVRPLLTVSAAQIRDYCAAENIPTVQDSTNGDTAYTRNFIRSEIVPRLRQITPSPEASAVRMSALLRTDADYLRDACRDALGEFAQKRAAPLSLLQPMPEAILHRAVGVLYENAAGEGDLSSVHVRDTAALIRKGKPGRIDLPGGMSARLFDGMLTVLSREECLVPEPPQFCAELRPGANFFAEFGFCIVLGGKNAQELSDGKNIYKLSTWYSFPYDTIQNGLLLRFRRAGDTVCVRGNTKTLKKLLNEKRIPPEKRARLPVLCDKEGILWIPGVYARIPETGEKTISVYNLADSFPV